MYAHAYDQTTQDMRKVAAMIVFFFTFISSIQLCVEVPTYVRTLDKCWNRGIACCCACNDVVTYDR